jgi:hypothetical protein
VSGEESGGENSAAGGGGAGGGGGAPASAAGHGRAPRGVDAARELASKRSPAAVHTMSVREVRLLERLHGAPGGDAVMVKDVSKGGLSITRHSAQSISRVHEYVMGDSAARKSFTPLYQLFGFSRRSDRMASNATVKVSEVLKLLLQNPGLARGPDDIYTIALEGRTECGCRSGFLMTFSKDTLLAHADSSGHLKWLQEQPARQAKLAVYNQQAYSAGYLPRPATAAHLGAVVAGALLGEGLTLNQITAVSEERVLRALLATGRRPASTTSDNVPSVVASTERMLLDMTSKYKTINIVVDAGSTTLDEGVKLLAVTAELYGSPAVCLSIEPSRSSPARRVSSRTACGQC